MVMVCASIIYLQFKKIRDYPPPPPSSYIFPVILLVSGGFVKCNAANLIPV